MDQNYEDASQSFLPGKSTVIDLQRQIQLKLKHGIEKRMKEGKDSEHDTQQPKTALTNQKTLLPQSVDADTLQSPPLPITARAIECIPTVSLLCQPFELMCQMAAAENGMQEPCRGHHEGDGKAEEFKCGLNLERKDFAALMKMMNTKCIDGDSYKLFDFLLE